MEEISNKILKNYLLGRCSPREMERLTAWARESDEHARWLFRMTDAYHAYRASHQIDEAHVQRAELDLLNRIAKEEKARKHRNGVRWAMYAAAAVLAALFVMTGLHYRGDREEMVRIVALNGVRHVLLPDSSEVWLNAHSTLRYPRHFNDDDRQLELDGEAYFEVRPDADRPFVVKNEFLTTRVLGTRFNFSTRATDNTAEVTLLSGKVKVSGNHGEGMITLRPDQRVILDKASRSMEIVQTYAPVSAAWHNKVIPFTNMRIDEIVKALEEYYDVRIDISPRLQNRATYTGVINCRPTIDSVLADLSYSVPFTFHRKNGCLVLVAKQP